MKEKVQKALGNKLLMGIVFILTGVGLILARDSYTDIVVRVIGALLVIVAVIRTVVFIRGPKQVAEILGFVVSVLLLACGILFLVRPDIAERFLYILFGGLVILEAVTGIIVSAGVLRKAGMQWTAFLIIYLIVAAAGVLIILQPGFLAKISVIFMGASMCAGGLTDTVLFFMRKKAGKLQENKTKE